MFSARSLPLVIIIVASMATGCVFKKKLVTVPDNTPVSIPVDSNFSVDQVAVKFKDAYNIRLEEKAPRSNRRYRNELNRIFQQYRVKKYDRPLKGKSLNTVYRIVLQDKNFENTYRFVQALKKLSYVEYVELVPIVHADIVPNDPQNTNQYHLALIKAYQAFDIHQGGAKIAIIDTGFDMDHQDLENTIWTNPGEIAANGIDDDGDGYIDDVHGWDTGDNDNDPNLIPQISYLNYWHGTHVAGVAGADTDNGIGITSMGLDNTIIPIKATKDSDGDLDAWAVINAITYAQDVGTDVINLSLSFDAPWLPLETACTDAYTANIIVVASAGNLPTQTRKKRYPAFYPNVICVAATDSNDKIMITSGGGIIWSNYGDDIDISAPGRFVYSTMPNDNYVAKSGTSGAAPIIAGLAGLMKSKCPVLTPDQFKHCIQQTAVDIDNTNPGYAGWLGAGRVDAEQAIQCCIQECLPANQISLSAITTTPNLPEFIVGNSINFNCTVVGAPTSYEWVVYKNGFILHTETSSSPSLNYTPAAIGNYKVKLTAYGISAACNQTIFHYFKAVCGINASFTMNTLIAPGALLNVINTSSNSNSVNYTWHLDGVPYSFLPPVTVNDPGAHLLKLVAFNYDYNCSIEHETYFTVFECPIDPPLINDFTVCTNQNVVLSPANSSNYTVNWYDQITDITPLFTGTTYTPGPFMSPGTFDYFVEYTSEAPVYLVGESSSPGGTAAYNSNYSMLYLQSNVDFYFKSFKVDVAFGGNISFTLRNSSNVIVWNITNYAVTSGIQLIDGNNTYCPAGTYTLTKEYSNGLPWMWEYSNASFPYSILNGDFSITGSYNNTYPAYYDIAISTVPNCISSREAVLVNVVNNSTDSDGDGICDSGDQCPGLNDNLIGTPCDDGDPCTTNDVYDNNCNCAGTPVTTFNVTVKDDPGSDTGMEPNPGNIWNGQVWNCANNMACTHATKENPEYKTFGFNIMKVKIDNIGCADHLAGQARLHLYWTLGKTGETWPTDWFNPMFQPSNTIDGNAGGGEITPSGGVAIPFISTGGFVEMTQNWTPPDPAGFPSLSSTPMICFLARIESIEDPIVGESTGNIGANVKNSNNIATINSTLVDIDPGNLKFPTYSVLLNNPSREPITMNLAIEDVDNRIPSFFEHGTIEATLQPLGRREEGNKTTIELKRTEQKGKIKSGRIEIKPGETVQAIMTFKHSGKGDPGKNEYRYVLKMTGDYNTDTVQSTEFLLDVKVKVVK